MTPGYKAFENIVGKEEIAVNQHFFFSHIVFYPPPNLSIWVIFILSFANALIEGLSQLAHEQKRKNILATDKFLFGSQLLLE